MCEVRTVAIPKTHYRYEVRYVWTVAKLKKISSENLTNKYVGIEMGLSNNNNNRYG